MKSFDNRLRKSSLTPALTIEATNWLDFVSVRKLLTEVYYYDEHTLTLTKNSDDNDFPPEGMDLSDAWVVAVLRSGISGEERSDRYPTVFTKKGLKAAYINKGQCMNHRGNICSTGTLYAFCGNVVRPNLKTLGPEHIPIGITR